MKELPGYAVEDKVKLEAWDNQARAFLHEVTHLDNMIHAPEQVPVIDDIQVVWNSIQNVFDFVDDPIQVTQKDWAYGPRFAKMLRNYGLGSEVGFYAQRNGEFLVFVLFFPCD